jgi:4-hydroxy-2-oxoglutarate aldolase
MILASRLSGILAPIPTTFDSGGAPDLRAIRENVARWMATRLSGLLVLGSNGEAALLDDAEADAVVTTVRDGVPSDRLLLAGVGRESTRATIEAARRAASARVDAVLVRPPSFFKAQMTADALYAHFAAVADASTVPVLLYNLPGVTGFTLTPALVARLADHPNIVGMKETSPELERLGQFTALDGFRVFSGWAPVLLPAIAAGASGGILAVANVAPDTCMDLYECASAGRIGEAREIQRALTLLAQQVSSVYGVPGLKAALDLIGYHGGPVRPPLQPADARTREEIRASVDALHAYVGRTFRSGSERTSSSGSEPTHPSGVAGSEDPARAPARRPSPKTDADTNR